MYSDWVTQCKTDRSGKEPGDLASVVSPFHNYGQQVAVNATALARSFSLTPATGDLRPCGLSPRESNAKASITPSLKGLNIHEQSCEL